MLKRTIRFLRPFRLVLVTDLEFHVIAMSYPVNIDDGDRASILGVLVLRVPFNIVVGSELNHLRRHSNRSQHPVLWALCRHLPRFTPMSASPAPAKPVRATMCEVSALSGFATISAWSDTSALHNL